jgi:FkbM family methyltransferase
MFVKIVKPLVERFPRLALLYRSLRDSRSIGKTPQMTPLGFKFIGCPEMEAGTYEMHESVLFEKCLANADIFIDAGANVGYYCCKALKEGKKTIAFEPIALNLRYLYKNIEANGWTHDIEVFPMALGDKTGLVEIYGGAMGATLVKGFNSVSEDYKRLVPLSTLDTVLGGRLSGKRCFFVIDVDGAEKQTLEGASRHLSMMPKPIWMVEVQITDHQPKDTKINPELVSTFQLFYKNGYRAFTADDRLRPVLLDELSKINETGVDTLHTHNFLFVGENNEHLITADK